MRKKHFDVGGQGRKTTRDHTLIKQLKSPGLIVSASSVSNTKFLSSDSNELCNRLKLSLPEKHAGNFADLFNKEIFAILD